MINFINSSSQEPYKKLIKLYKKAEKANQSSIDALYVSSYSQTLKEVDSRLVNLKIVDDKDFIFFSNYNSKKSIQFNEHSQISAVIYWNTINIQIRMKSIIKKTFSDFNKEYFAKRSMHKNALAISSHQSKPINSYSQVKENYNKSLKNDDLKKCPEFWGGYAFTPYYFEFWEGREARLNKRKVYEKSDDAWKYLILQP